jgi:prepilin-type N-terminal cleavage/methylation domain-containing protein
MRSAPLQRPGGICRRAGFTLIELMVVVAIIGVIVVLTTAAAMQTVSYQRTNTTDETIKTISSLLDQQWSAVLAKANNEVIPNSVFVMAGGNEKRARVIWKKLRLKQAFPMNFTEALTPGNPPSLYVQPSILPGMNAYQSAILSSGLKPSTNPADWPKESAYCLVLALRQGFGGNSFSEERFGANALGSDPGVVGMKKFVDGWGNPLVFYRWPAANAELDNSSPLGVYNPVSPIGTKTWFRDPLDPEGLLESPDWNNPVNFATKQGVWWFEQYCHTVHDTTSIHPVRFQRSHYMVPVIASAGRDGMLGFQPPTSPLLPDPMANNLLNPALTFDNIYSYRIRLGGRGGQ